MLSWEQTQFNGKIVAVTEDEMKISLSEDSDRQLRQRLYEEYCEAGKPRRIKAWLRPRLAKLFVSVAGYPCWAEGIGIWPFHNGKPMIFIKQFQVPQNDVVETSLAPEAILYVFGVRDYYDEFHFRMHYRVIAQYPDLEDLVAVVDDPEDLDSIHLEKL